MQIFIKFLLLTKIFKFFFKKKFLKFIIFIGAENTPPSPAPSLSMRGSYPVCEIQHIYKPFKLSFHYERFKFSRKVHR